MDRSPFGLASEAQRRHTEIESDRSEQWNLPYLITKTFDILYHEADFPQAVQSILKLSGELFEVSRVYIFENSGDGWFCSNTFEWCAEGIEPQIQNLQMLPYLEEGHDYRDYFGEDGLFYCQNIRKVNDKEFEILDQQNILSTLQFAIRENGEFRGFVGFDDCKVRRLWTEEQINGLTFMGKLMSVFLLKYRAQEALSVSVKKMQSERACRDIPAYKSGGPNAQT